MSIEKQFSKLTINQFINVFKNPNKLPINEIHLERQSRELRRDRAKSVDFLETSSKDITDSFFETKLEIIPALDKRWLPKVILPKFEPFPTLGNEEEKLSFQAKNLAFIDGLEYLLNCNFHQFWCTILFEPSAAISLQSFLSGFLLPCQTKHLQECLQVYQTVFTDVLLVYEKLLTFRFSETEHIPQSYAIQKLKERKLLSLPIVISLSILYSNTNMSFVNKLTDLYFNDTQEMEFLIKEVESFVDQNQIILEMIGGQICGFDENATIVPISLEKRPLVFNLWWIYTAVHYLLSIVVTLNAFFHVHKPAVEIAMERDFPLRLPYMYVNIYRELYELLDNRDEETTDLFKLVIEEINLGRREIIELYHTFVSNCLDEALKHMGDTAKQESTVETYLRLLTTALEDEYFICDYNEAYSVANQNEMFESCCDIDQTRTQFIVQCVKKLPRHKKLQELSKVKRQTLERVFKEFAPAHVDEEPVVQEPQAGSSRVQEDRDVEGMIGSIIDMFPHLGDGYVYQCLESYNFNSADVINAILENNLPPHLAEIPFDSIRIPPEPEPEKPILAYKGKKPDYDDALALLNDKRGIKDIKNLVLEGVQFDYDYMYDDEYDDRDNDDVIAVPDNPVTEEVCNPNRRPGRLEESEEESEEETSTVNSVNQGRNFCEDPAVVRARREARFGGGPSRPRGDVVGKPKGQGQDNSTLVNRQKKNANKSSRANHSRKGGAQFKRNRGMIPS